MSDPTTSKPIGTSNTVVPRDPMETLENETVVLRNEHIARLTQEIEDLRGEMNRIKDLTSLSITLQSSLPEPRNVTPNLPHFPSLKLSVPEHFPPQHSPHTKNNLPPTTTANPSNQLPINTPP
ncbi:hypothetical protein CQW23_23544 [Capsicum baccatum]|uniref:Uncharacterized protein n=1 Tax=Capsicum baccatum TaxID=33114 RepID=A0A2G2VS80_CAPBA|nr:hypothetical protein CQW23_23544 [Capsicum baccatum]